MIDQCVNGHDTTEQESRDASGNCRACRAAARKRSHKRKTPRKATPPAEIINRNWLVEVALDWDDQIERETLAWRRDELKMAKTKALEQARRQSHTG